METVFLEKTSAIKRNLKKIQEKLKVRLSLTGKKLTISSEDSINEYEALSVLEAINFGFSVDKALLLKDPEFSFQTIHIKDFTRKKSLESVRSRIIGKHGKTRKTLEQISDCFILIKDNYIGIISHSDNQEEVITAITNIIKGTKQTNAYRFLERMNRNRSEQK
jgi:ribosomal RNA assembly protein